MIAACGRAEVRSDARLGDESMTLQFRIEHSVHSSESVRELRVSIAGGATAPSIDSKNHCLLAARNSEGELIDWAECEFPIPAPWLGPGQQSAIAQIEEVPRGSIESRVIELPLGPVVAGETVLIDLRYFDEDPRPPRPSRPTIAARRVVVRSAALRIVGTDHGHELRARCSSPRGMVPTQAVPIENESPVLRVLSPPGRATRRESAGSVRARLECNGVEQVIQSWDLELRPTRSKSIRLEWLVDICAASNGDDLHGCFPTVLQGELPATPGDE